MSIKAACGETAERQLRLLLQVTGFRCEPNEDLVPITT
jgi:hypothetical protein